jgi:hypothetical protein
MSLASFPAVEGRGRSQHTGFARRPATGFWRRLSDPHAAALTCKSPSCALRVRRGALCCVPWPTHSARGLGLLRLCSSRASGKEFRFHQGNRAAMETDAARKDVRGRASRPLWLAFCNQVSDRVRERAGRYASTLRCDGNLLDLLSCASAQWLLSQWRATHPRLGMASLRCSFARIWRHRPAPADSTARWLCRSLQDLDLGSWS